MHVANSGRVGIIQDQTAPTAGHLLANSSKVYSSMPVPPGPSQPLTIPAVGAVQGDTATRPKKLDRKRGNVTCSPKPRSVICWKGGSGEPPAKRSREGVSKGKSLSKSNVQSPVSGGSGILQQPDSLPSNVNVDFPLNVVQGDDSEQWKRLETLLSVMLAPLMGKLVVIEKTLAHFLKICNISHSEEQAGCHCLSQEEVRALRPLSSRPIAQKEDGTKLAAQGPGKVLNCSVLPR